MSDKTRRLQILRGDPSTRTSSISDGQSDSTCITFVMIDEDHTLGNALRYILMKNPEVQFCGYSVPHPLENKIHLRIQTYVIPAQEVLRKGLEDLRDICEHVLDTFQVAVTDDKFLKT